MTAAPFKMALEKARQAKTGNAPLTLTK
jgi:hypothetical protein